MLGKVGATADTLTPILAEQLAEILFEIGKDQFKQHCYVEAVYWFERSHNTFLNQDVGAMSCDASDLKVSTVQSLIRALMHLEGDHDRTRSWSLIHELEVEHGGRFAILLLKLDLYTTGSNPSPQEYSDVLHKIMDIVHLTESNILTILHHTHRLRSWSPSMAHRLLVHLISERLLIAEQWSWAQKMLIIVIWNSASSLGIPGILDSLKRLFDTIVTRFGHPLNPSATHAAQVLLWRRVESSYQQKHYDVSEAWCELSLHEIFSNSEAMNIGKLQRKLILCALAQADLVKARKIYAEMSISHRKELSTQYLLYKIALRCQESETAIRCLDSVCKAAAKDTTILYACVLEAQNTGDQTQTIASLLRVLQKLKQGKPDGVNLPALFRCTARLLVQQSRAKAAGTEDISKEICEVFESAATQARNSQLIPEDSLFTLAELDWFSRNSYNLALKNCTDWPPESVSSLVTSCVHFVDLYPSDLDPGILADLSLRRLFCNFLLGSLSIVRARQGDCLETRLQHYLELRKAVEGFRVQFTDQMHKIGDGARDDLRQKYITLLAYDYEAVNHMKSWGSLESIIKVPYLLPIRR